MLKTLVINKFLYIMIEKTESRRISLQETYHL